ncbi:MAG: tripartite tricarboxylate transporter permease, partial [Candidatus Woesearchaeota archaeon]
GLFGISTLIISLQGNECVKEQKIENEIPLKFSDVEKTIPRATLVGILASFLPGFGSSHGAIVATTTMKKPEEKHYLLLTGGINTVNFTFSIMTLYILGKARNGAILAVGEIISKIKSQDILIFVSVLMIVGSLATFLGIFLSKKFAKFISKINYKKLVKSIIIFVTLIVLLLSGLQGILILITATSLGLLTNFYKGQKNMLLGCLIVPVIFYLW